MNTQNGGQNGVELVQVAPVSYGMRATIAIPLYNNSRWIGAQLDSLFAQWQPDFELLVVDDGSEDGGLDVVMNRLSERPDIVATVLRHGQSQSSALIDAFARYSSAPVIIQADSDDITLPGRLETILDRFERDPRCRLVSSNAVLLSDGDIPMGILDPVRGDRIVDGDDQLPVFWGALWYGATLAYHRSIFESFPPMDAELCPYGFDIVAPLRATLLGTHHLIARPLVGWRQHTNSTHRRAGATSNTAIGAENYAALELMVKAQLIRDAIWLRDRSNQQDAERINAVIARCQQQFFQHFDHWSRLRNSLDRASSAVAQPQALPKGKPLPDIPPIVTLPTAGPWRLENQTPLMQALSRWMGFNPPESFHIWTQRQTLVVLRITTPDAIALAITMSSHSSLPPARAFVSINAGEEVEVPLTQNNHCVVEVPLKTKHEKNLPWHGLTMLSIRVPEADAPSNRFPDNPDTRILGAAIFALEVICTQKENIPHLGELLHRMTEECDSWNLESGPLTPITNGWLSEREMRLLYGLTRVLDGPILEIGAWVGRSTSVIARALRDAGSQKRFVSTEIQPLLEDFKSVGEEVHYFSPQCGGQSIGQISAAVFDANIAPVLKAEGGVVGTLTRNLDELGLLPYVTIHVGDFAAAPDLGYSFIFNDCAHNAVEIERSAAGLRAFIGDRTIIMAAHDHTPEGEAMFRALFDVHESMCVDTLFVCRMSNR